PRCGSGWPQLTQSPWNSQPNRLPKWAYWSPPPCPYPTNSGWASPWDGSPMPASPTPHGPPAHCKFGSDFGSIYGSRFGFGFRYGFGFTFDIGLIVGSGFLPILTPLLRILVLLPRSNFVVEQEGKEILDQHGSWSAVEYVLRDSPIGHEDESPSNPAGRTNDT
ncbi:hypothetical protein Ccrd_003891, partial [Cynara cardunculus var. scolymus]